MDSIKNLYNLSSSVISTTLSHFFLDGPPNKSWDYKFHVLFSIIRDTMDLKSGVTIEELRKNIENKASSPPEGFHFTAKTIPDWCREKAHAIIKEKLIKELGEYPIVREDAFWRNCDKLQLEFAVSKGGKPENGDKETLIYVHGGGYFFGSANTHMEIICELASKSGCQIASLNYRLAPEYPFPCALEDTLATYLFLTSSDSEQLGMGIHPKFITIAGDSAGGNLATSFLLLLASLKQYEMIAGGLLLSPWLDLTGSLPSFLTNKADYLDGPGLEYELENNKKDGRGKTGFIGAREVKPWDALTKSMASSCKKFEEEIIEKKHFFTNEKFLNYYLVSPLFTKDFEGLPPIMIIIGDGERLRDESILFSRRLNAYSSSKTDISKHTFLPPVTLHLYQSMPHVFQFFSFHPMAKLSYTWGSNFLRQCLNFSKASSTDSKLLENYPIGNYTTNKDDEGAKLWAYMIDEKLDMNAYKIDSELEKLGKKMEYFYKDEGGQ